MCTVDNFNSLTMWMYQKDVESRNHIKSKGQFGIYWQETLSLFCWNEKHRISMSCACRQGLFWGDKKILFTDLLSLSLIFD